MNVTGSSEHRISGPLGRWGAMSCEVSVPLLHLYENNCRDIDVIEVQWNLSLAAACEIKPFELLNQPVAYRIL